MKLEELFNTLQSQPNGDLSSLLGAGTLDTGRLDPPFANSNSSQPSSSLPPSQRLNFAASPNPDLSAVPRNIPDPSTTFFDQLFNQNAAEAKQRLQSTFDTSNQSAHNLLDGLMKSPDGSSPLSQNGIFRDDFMVQRPFQPPHANSMATSQLSASHSNNRQHSPSLMSAAAMPGHSTTNQLPNSGDASHQESAITSQSNDAYQTKSNSNGSLSYFHPLPPYPYQYHHLQSPPSPLVRLPGPFVVPPPPPTSASAFPGFFPQPFAFAPPSRPAVSPFPQTPQVPYQHSQVPPFSAQDQARFRHTTLFQAAPHVVPLPSPQQQLAYQHYFSYYFNCLTKPSFGHRDQPPGFANELESKAESAPFSGDQNSLKCPSNPLETSPLGSGSPSKKAVPIRLDVNDLFSLSKAYSEKNTNTDPNKILFELIQKQQMSEDRSLSISNAGDALATRSKNGEDNEGKWGSIQSGREDKEQLGPDTRAISGSKVPKELANLNENFCLELLKQLRKDLLTTTQSIRAIVQAYDWKKSNYMFTMIKQYFEHIAARLQVENVTHLNLIDSLKYSYDDFASYGPRFRDYVKESNLFSPETIAEYTALLTSYERCYPDEIIELRQKLLAIKLNLCLRQRQQSQAAKASEPSKSDQSLSYQMSMDRSRENQTNVSQVGEAAGVPAAADCPVDYHMVTYRKIDARRLHTSVSSIKGVRDQVALFISQICLSPEGEHNRDQFLNSLNEALRSSEFAQFGPRLHKFGSLSNGLGTYDSDLDIVIKLDKVNVDILDYGTSMLALEVIELILQEKLGIRAKDTIVPSKRCPIIKLNFSVCFPGFREIFRKDPKSFADIEFNKCDISLITVYGVHNSRLLKFFTLYDRRFYEMTLVLKYWAKKNELIDTTAFSTYGFTMMIIFFLQNTKPPVLPSIAQLQELAKKQSGKEEVKVHKFNFEFCDDIATVGKSKNTQSLQELLLEFFRFYATFDFYNHAISPRFGTSVKKIHMRADKLSHHYDNFNMACYVCIEDPFVLEHNVGYIFRARNIQRWNNIVRSNLYKLNPNNCIRVLIDPSNFNIGKLIGGLIYLPFNLYCHEVTVSAHFLSYPIQPSAISLSAVTYQVPIDKSIASMKKFYYIVIRHLLVGYFALPNSMAAYQLELAPDGIVCSIDFSYLSHINFKLDLRNHKVYDPLFQNSRKRASDGIKRFTLLKMLRDDLKRPGNPKDLRSRSVNPSGVLERWFKLETAHPPPVHQAQMPQASYSALLAANELPIPYFIFRQMVLQNSGKFATANKFGELLQEVLQQFSFSIDRANPVASFNGQVEEFFD